MVDEKPERNTKTLKQQAEELDWTGVSFPTPIDGPDIRTFEENNDKSVVILGFDTTHEFGEKKEFFHPLRVPSGPEKSRVVRLAYVQESNDQYSTIEEPVVVSHYCVIKNLSRLLSSQISKHGHAHNYLCN